MQCLAAQSVQKRNLMPWKALPSRRASLYVYHVVIVYLDWEVYTRPEETCTEGEDDTLALMAFGVQEGSGYCGPLRETFRARIPLRPWIFARAVRGLVLGRDFGYDYV